MTIAPETPDIIQDLEDAIDEDQETDGGGILEITVGQALAYLDLYTDLQRKIQELS